MVDQCYWCHEEAKTVPLICDKHQDLRLMILRDPHFAASVLEDRDVRIAELQQEIING